MFENISPGGDGAHTVFIDNIALVEHADTYTVTVGKHCGGTSIYVWADGESAGYGVGYVNDIAGCKSVCSEHVECAGFVLRASDNRCSFWKSGSLSLYDVGGHDCYSKQVSP